MIVDIKTVKTAGGWGALKSSGHFMIKEGFFKTLPKKMQDYMAADMTKVNLDFQGIMAENYNENDLKNILCEVLLLCGRHSPELSHILINKITKAIPNADKLYFDAGHMGAVVQSEIIHPVIAKFIQSNGA